MPKCSICGHEMTKHGLFADCGGDCLVCMATVGDDPDCMRQVADLAKKYHRQLELVKNNLYRSMSHSIQRVQARSIQAVLQENGES